MKDRDIDDILQRTAAAQPDVDPALLTRIAQSIGPSVKPVRVLPAPWILSLASILICMIAAGGGAFFLGLYGIQELSGVQAGLIFSLLILLLWLAARLCVAEVIPGSGRPLAPWMLIASGCAALAATFGLLFRDYQTEDFFSEGWTCLKTGLLFALPTSVATWGILRRGFAVDPLAAGLATGALGGLAGITMLELHCPYFEAPHLLVWHIAVLPVSAALGALAALTRQAYRRWQLS